MNELELLAEFPHAAVAHTIWLRRYSGDINWSKIPTNFHYVAKDSGGSIVGYEYEPFIVDECEWWCDLGILYRMDWDAVHEAYRNTVDWRHSLRQRPEAS